MSRVGLKKIVIPDGVSIEILDDSLKVTGPKGELSTPVPRGITFEQADNELCAQRTREDKQTRAFHGLARAMAANAVAKFIARY